MDKLFQEIVHQIRTSSKRIIISISGHGAAGKTTFASKLIKALGEQQVNYLNTDPYIIDSEIRRHTIIDYTYENNHHRFKLTACHPAAHHLPSLERDIRMLKTGMDLWTIDTQYQKRQCLSSKNKLTIVEGMSAAFIATNLFDRTLYFYTDSETEYKRRAVRDIEERGKDIDYLRLSHHERRIQYELFMHPYSAHFDSVIKTTNGRAGVEKHTSNDSF